jgi:very-short-patch-repair endonuclease
VTARPAAAAGVRESQLETHLRLALAAAGLPRAEQEYRFHPDRRWRLDFCWPALKLAVEIEGGIYRGGGHTSVTGVKRDLEKGNALTMAGYRLLRFHADQIKSGEAVAVIREAFELFSGGRPR